MTNILLATSNGTGMGHLTRQAAVALALGEQHVGTLFSLSVGLPSALGLGLRGEYCPSYDQPWISPRDWHAYLRDRLLAVIDETRARVVLFDGVAPYPGIGLASAQARNVAFVWLRRGMWQRGANTAQLGKGAYFDLVIEPGDLAAAADQGPTAGRGDARLVSPISLVEVLEPMTRHAAREALELPLDRHVALITLGSGRLGDVAGPGLVSVNTLLEATDWHIAVTRSAVARNQVPIGQTERVTELKSVYPLARYLLAFDAAVSSAGYNAAHELIPAGIPTLLVANTSTRTDDQRGRAQQLERDGRALAVDDDDMSALSGAVKRLVEDAVLSELGANALATKSLMTGAEETGKAVIELASGFTRRRPSLRVMLGLRMHNAREALKGVLGEERTNSLRRTLGRQPRETGLQPKVTLGGGHARASGEGVVGLRFAERVEREDLGGSKPVEHLLAASSTEYRKTRLEIIRRYYNLVD